MGAAEAGPFLPAWASWVGSILVGFLLGSIPFGLVWGRAVRGVDVRRSGSGNLGATNVFRVLGPAHGVAVLVLDAAKGVAAVALALSLTDSEGIALAAGMAAVLGHILSPWVGFRGGKGVATSLGVWIVLAPLASAIALGVWALALAISRRVSAASLLAATALAPCVLLTRPDHPVLVGIAAAMALLVWLRHRANVARLLAGTEPPLWGKRS